MGNEEFTMMNDEWERGRGIGDWRGRLGYWVMMNIEF
jgi:hypothetical protein